MQHTLNPRFAVLAVGIVAVSATRAVDGTVTAKVASLLQTPIAFRRIAGKS
jgi:hypothetical protein